MQSLINILESVITSYTSIWPYLLITIPLAVAIQVWGLSKKISMIFRKSPVIAIVLATAVGAFSPLCSCGVIPLVTSLLIGGVPLAPVMAFWIASPSSDPELLPLSIATIGWNLSIWRLVSSLVISLAAGFIIHLATVKGWLGSELLRNTTSHPKKVPSFISRMVYYIKSIPGILFSPSKPAASVTLRAKTVSGAEVSCCVTDISLQAIPLKSESSGAACNTCDNTQGDGSFYHMLLNESGKAVLPVIKYMTLAFFITALIKEYLPAQMLTSFFSTGGWSSVIMAATIGVPTYTSNLLALPLVGDFLQMGMNPAAALAFLMAGPVTTIPALVAVWGIASRKVFFLYLVFSYMGAVGAGMLLLIVS